MKVIRFNLAMLALFVITLSIQVGIAYPYMEGNEAFKVADFMGKTFLSLHIITCSWAMRKEKERRNKREVVKGS